MNTSALLPLWQALRRRSASSAFAAAIVIALGASVAGASTPCVPYKFEYFPSGYVDGTFVAAILNYGGSNGGATDMLAFWTVPGGNGALTVNTKINAYSDGDRLEVIFVKKKMLVSNAIYLGNEAHCCYTHLAVQRYGMSSKLQLTREAVATLRRPTPPHYTRDWDLCAARGKQTLAFTQWVDAVNAAIVKAAGL